ncbi:MAG: hypothetical protein ACE5G2_04365 [Candidatus Krumholzibacteriia bacterium]
MSHGSRQWRRLACTASLVALAIVACSLRIEMPEEPESAVITGEIAYVVQYRWEDVPPFGDMVLTRGQGLYVVEDSARVKAYFSNTAAARENAGRSIPEPVRVDGQELSKPVQLCEGPDNTLWVAFLEPEKILLQFDLAVAPPELTGRSVQDPAFQEFGGIGADLDSGFVYVADAVANTITKYEPSETGGTAVAVLASEGNGDHFVREPRGLHFFSDSLLVADSGKSWLQVIGADVPFSGPGQVQGTEADPLQLRTPADVWVDRSGRFYVADSGNSRVLQLTSLGEIKEVVTELDPESARQPRSVVANTTQVWVADPETGSLTVYQINTVSEDVP